jgi:hypothetical protein
MISGTNSVALSKKKARFSCFSKKCRRAAAGPKAPRSGANRAAQRRLAARSAAGGRGTQSRYKRAIFESGL